jgi:Sigma-70 region 2
MGRGGGIDERFAAYVREHGDRHLRVAVLLTGDWHAAEDLVQASLVKLYRAWPRLDTDAGRLPAAHHGEHAPVLVAGSLAAGDPGGGAPGRFL